MYLPVSRRFSIFIGVWFVLLAPAVVLSQKDNSETKVQANNNLALSYGFVIDNSGSFRLMLENVILFTNAIIKENAPDDEAFLVRYIGVDKVTLEQDLTNSKSDLIDAAEAMYIEGGQAAMIDAIGFSAKHLSENARYGEGRARILILITDGDERGSVAKLETTIQFLRENKIKVIAIAVSDDKVQTKALDRLTRDTGGKLFVMKSAVQLPSAAQEVAAFIRKP